jgi:hypothetical protein
MSEPVSAELAVPEQLLDVVTGEVLPASVPNAARVLEAVREMGRRIAEVKAAATYFLEERSRVEGTKTFQLAEGGKVVLSGGDSTDYDAEALANGLRAAGCPEERVSEAVREEHVVTFRVDRAVLRQLRAANPEYGDVIDQAARLVSSPVRASVKP